MKIFTPANSFNDRINFVDKNNCVVGYEMKQDCCEYVNWTISKKDLEISDEETADNLIKRLPCSIPDDVKIEEYCFDITYKPNQTEVEIQNDECMNAVSFRLFKYKKDQKDKKTFLYLHLYNIQNGYYSHGWDITTPELERTEGII